ncbi:murein L,D-transpeptidase [Bacteroidia bacterium]|nr:murein L,D-transpeptidase [Bacteroidia bacterium]
MTMNYTRQVLTIFVVFLLLCTCNNKKPTAEVPDFDYGLSVYDFLTKNNVDSLIFEAYSNNDFRPFWIDNKGFTDAFNAFFSELSTAENHGLSLNKMKADSIAIFAERVRQNADIELDSLALFDYFTTVAYLNFCKTLCFGALHPKRDMLTNYYFDTQQNTAEFTEKCLKNIGKDIAAFLQSLPQQSEYYKLIQNERKYYVSLQDSVFEKIPILSEKQTLKIGDKNAIIPLIVKRLLLVNEISAANADSALITQKFDTLLLKSINNFQKKRGLLVDNEIGNNTIKALNVPFKDLIKTIDVNLERMRWKLDIAQAEKHIHVNVANQTLAAFCADTVALRMKVVAGEPPDHLTPFLFSKIYDITLNPLWRVPQRIIVEEIALKAAASKNYISRNKMKVYRGGVLVNSDSIDWTKITGKSSPYSVVQDAGNGNSLGRIKFNFANPFAVYLHDTNAKGAFSRHNRSISHGCVRVEQPYELAYFCLPPMSTEKMNLLKDKILFSTDRQPQSDAGKALAKKDSNALKINNVSVNPKIPVVLEYYTCFVDENKNVVFCNDIYGIDDELYAKLR